MKTFDSGLACYDYTVVRSQRRSTVAITIQPGGTVRILAPSRLSDEEISAVAADKRGWVMKKLAEFARSEVTQVDHRYEEGEQFALLGSPRTLHLSQGRADTRIDNERVVVTVPHGLRGDDRRDFIRDTLGNLFRQQALEILREKSHTFGNLLNLHPPYVSVKNYKSRWGCCFGDGRIYYNWRIIMAPEEIVDYIVVHELCHLREPNHSKRFWALVTTILPNWQHARKWLRLNGHGLRI